MSTNVKTKILDTSTWVNEQDSGRKDPYFAFRPPKAVVESWESQLGFRLGFQFWMYGGRVNLYGILTYIRRMRPMAFEETGDKNQTFFVQMQWRMRSCTALRSSVKPERVSVLRFRSRIDHVWIFFILVSKYEAWIKEILGKVSTPATNEFSGRSPSIR